MSRVLSAISILGLLSLSFCAKKSGLEPSASSEASLATAIAVVANELPGKRASLYLVSPAQQIAPLLVSGQSEVGEVDELYDTPLALIIQFKVEESSSAAINASGIEVSGQKCFGWVIMKADQAGYCINHEISELSSNASGTLVYFSGQEYTGTTPGTDGVFRFSLPPAGGSIQVTRVHTFTGSEYQGIEVTAEGDLMVATSPTGGLKIVQSDGTSQSVSGGRSSDPCFLAGVRGSADQNLFFYATSSGIQRLEKISGVYSETPYATVNAPSCTNPAQIARTVSGIFIGVSGTPSTLVHLIGVGVPTFAPGSFSLPSSNLTRVAVAGDHLFAMDATHLDRFEVQTSSFSSLFSSGYQLETLDTTYGGDLIFSGLRTSDQAGVVSIVESGTSVPKELSSSVGEIKRIRGISH